MEQERRKTNYLAAICILLFWAGDVVSLGFGAWQTLLIRLPWAGLFFGTGFLVGRVQPQTIDRLTTLNAAASSLVLAWLNVLLGDSVHTPFMISLALLPLLFGFIEVRHERPLWASGLSSLLAITLLLAREERPPLDYVLWVGNIALATTWSVLGFRAALRNRLAALDSARLAAVGRLAAGVAHEVNNPLAFVKANVAYIQEELENGTSDRDSLREIAAETQVGIDRIQRIVRDLQSYARADSDSEALFPLAEAVHESLRLASVRLRPEARVEVELAPDLPPLRGSKGRLVQVLVNLLVNAGDALQGRKAPSIRIRAAVEGGRIRCTVTDNGPGLPQEVKKRLFQPFVTTKAVGEGLGMGLSLCRTYVEKLGGTLVLGDAPGGGTVATIDLPLPVEEAPVAAA